MNNTFFFIGWNGHLVLLSELNNKHCLLDKVKSVVTEQKDISEEETKGEYIKECKAAIENLKTTWDKLNKDFSLLITNKIHVIEDHFIDYIDLTGKTLGESNDQVIETTHNTPIF